MISNPPAITYKLGRGILLFFAIANIFGQLGLLFFDNSASVFLVTAALNLLTTMILIIPYRNFENWACGFNLPSGGFILLDNNVGGWS